MATVSEDSNKENITRYKHTEEHPAVSGDEGAQTLIFFVQILKLQLSVLQFFLSPLVLQKEVRISFSSFFHLALQVLYLLMQLIPLPLEIHGNLK